MSTIGERFTAIREDLGLAQPAMAQLFGVSVSTWRNYEHGRTAPSEKIIDVLCEKYHVNREWLKNEIGEKYTAASVSGENDTQAAPVVEKKKGRGRKKAAEAAALEAPVVKKETAEETEAAVKEEPVKAQEADTTEAPAAKGKRGAKAQQTPAEEKKTRRGRKPKAFAAEETAEASAPAEAAAEVAAPVETAPVKEEAPAKKSAEKAVKAPAAKKAPVITIQSLMGGSITADEIVARVQAVVSNVDAIYVKPEENKAYWTSGKKAGFVELW